ncbi:hypothetical protein [Melittangium boletus]|uniref:hypothetical protein n=1 Tax=Melittangium boletus TaxID=83453 RepID=UPI003DA36ABC
MKLSLFTPLLCAFILTGCNYRLHIQKKAEWAAPEEMENVKPPSSVEGSISLDGQSLKAIEIAMDEFLPPGAKASSHDEKLARCLSSRENYDVSVFKSDEGIFFVAIAANLDRCGITDSVVDAGATYGIDAQGRIVLKH